MDDMSYTVNIEDKDGEAMKLAKQVGYHAYHADGVTAIETLERDKAKAEFIASRFGKVLYAFE